MAKRTQQPRKTAKTAALAKRQIDMFSQLSSVSAEAAASAPATGPGPAPAVPAGPRLGFLEVVEISGAFRLSRPICAEVDLTGEEPTFAVVGEQDGERVTALSRAEFLSLLGH